MHEIVQRENFAIGDKTLLDSLAEKESVSILLISDSHGSRVILREILQKFGSDADILCFCGDGIPDLVELLEQSHWDPELANSIPDVLFFVQGNGDNSTATILSGERTYISVPQQLLFTAAGKKIFMTHGHKYDVYYGTQTLYKTTAELEADAVFYGHTHIANAQRKTYTKDGVKKNIVLLNPGSCSIPRGGLPHTFAQVKITKENPKIEYSYYEIQRDENDDFLFRPYSAPSKDINLFW